MARILIVEDNEDNSDMLSRRLRKRGFEVEIVADGETCIKVVTNRPPDLILMDLGLPGIDGYEATRRLKAEAKTRTIPVIALSAHTLDDHLRLAEVAGCDDFDEKPVDISRLLRKMAALLPEGAVTRFE